jgi:hypothetical protein
MENITTPFARRDDLERGRAWSGAARSDAARSDAAIEEEIWTRIDKDRSLGIRLQENIAVEVEDGRVRLRGHVTQAWHCQRIASTAGQAAGVIRVQNDLTADEHLRAQVIKALLMDERTAPYVFVVRCSFGWVQIGGLVPGAEIASAAETVAGFVPAVRGILSLPTVFGAPWSADPDFEPVRRALQPRLAASVMQEFPGDKPQALGLVSQVILDPCSRLVRAIAVRPSGTRANSERLVPVQAIDAANERQVWLNEDQALEAYPLFDRCQYPLPPAGWRPPFPYTEGTVRWSL